MSEPSAEERSLIEAAYRAFNARDIDGALMAMTPDVAWANGQHGGHVHGHDAVRAYWTAQWREIDPHVEPIAINRRDDGTLAVTVRQVVRNLAGETLADVTIVHAFQLRSGLIARFGIER